VVGTPSIVAVLSGLLEKFRPGGNEEPTAAAQVQVYGVSPPDPLRLNPVVFPAYWVLSVPAGGAIEVIARIPGLTAREIWTDAGVEIGGIPESMQLKETAAALAVALGVPTTIPVLVLSVKPAGSVPDLMDQVKGGVPPCTKLARLNEKAWPTFPGCG
jgi:hypothetical protein